MTGFPLIEDRPVPFFPRSEDSFRNDDNPNNRRLYKATECRILAEKRVLDFRQDESSND